MNKLFFFLFFALALFSCDNQRNPNLSKKKLLALLNETTQKSEEISANTFPDTSYVPPAGAKYTEIRSIDPATPPVIIDIAGNLKNKKIFKLSDVASSVRNIRLQSPPDTKITSIRNVVSDDEHIFINAQEGLFCYSAEGQYLYTVVENQFEKSAHGIFLGGGNTNFFSNIDLFHGKLAAQIMDKGFTLSFFDAKEMDAQMFLNDQSNELKTIGIKPQYQRLLGRNGTMGQDQYLFLDEQSIFNTNLSIISINGDTICKFKNYEQLAVNGILKGMGVGSRVPTNIYRIHGQMMLQIDYNDTVFRVTPPNRLTPAYVMNWGVYKSEINERFNRNNKMEGKFALRKWVETSQFIFIHFIEGREPEIVKDYWAIYNKTTKTLTCYATSDKHALLENNIEPVGMPFWPEGVNHKNEMYMVFYKKRIKNIIEKGTNINVKLQDIYENMPDDAVFMMVVK